MNTTKICHEKCQNNLDEVKRFEMTTDFKNLPNSKELKCYMYCFMMACKVFKSDTMRLNTVFLMEQIEKLPRYQQDILFGMGRGCIRRILNIRDPVEIAYTLNVCSKENDNEVGVIIFQERKKQTCIHICDNLIFVFKILFLALLFLLLMKNHG